MRDYLPLAGEVRMLTPADEERRRRIESERARELIERRHKEEAEREQARVAAERERGAAELDLYETQARESVLASGGTAENFRRLWPDLKSRYLADRAVERMGARERRVSELYARMKDSIRL
jgi:membrane protein involved in colicin uptake